MARTPVEPDNHTASNRCHQKHVGSIVKGAVVRRGQPGNQPQYQQNRNELLSEGNNAQINHSQGHVQHVHSGKTEKCSGELGHGLSHIGELGAGLVVRHRREDGKRQAFGNQVAPFPSVQDDERRPA